MHGLHAVYVNNDYYTCKLTLYQYKSYWAVDGTKGTHRTGHITVVVSSIISHSISDGDTTVSLIASGWSGDHHTFNNSNSCVIMILDNVRSREACSRASEDDTVLYTSHVDRHWTQYHFWSHCIEKQIKHNLYHNNLYSVPLRVTDTGHVRLIFSLIKSYKQILMMYVYDHLLTRELVYQEVMMVL